ncbi:unannotated protein [freshwater metagenome]|uniref:Unannotated protein n=1 Tax=freshwater metagenome TaxID=449393 RepID=A0A6J7B0Y4_9ZZZZ
MYAPYVDDAIRSIGAAYDKFNTTVSSAVASTLLSASQINPAPPIFFDESRLAFTAAELTGVPSWNVAPARNLKVQVLPSFDDDHEVARAGEYSEEAPSGFFHKSGS